MLTKNTSKLRQLVEEHVAADQVIQHTYWDNEENKGCFIGCLNHSANPQGAEKRFGLPIMIQKIAESIFERLSEDDAKGFFAALPEAVKCDDKDLSKVGWQFLAAQLRGLPKVPKDIQGVIDPVIEGIDLLAEGKEWAFARAAANAANAAANAANAAAYSAYAADAAANAADAAANAAGYATDASADAADAAANAAGYATDASADAANAASNTAGYAAKRENVSKQRDLLLKLISDAPVLSPAPQTATH